MSEEIKVKAGGLVRGEVEQKPIQTVSTKKLNVEAACVNGFGADPAPNIIVINVTDPDGKPVTGLTMKDFTLVNFAMTDGHARLRQLHAVIVLSEELPEAAIDGVYRIWPKEELEITGQVGQSVYVVKVGKVEQSPGVSTYFSGQTVVPVVMQKKPW